MGSCPWTDRTSCCTYRTNSHRSLLPGIDFLGYRHIDCCSGSIDPSAEPPSFFIKACQLMTDSGCSAWSLICCCVSNCNHFALLPFVFVPSSESYARQVRLPKNTSTHALTRSSSFAGIRDKLMCCQHKSMFSLLSQKTLLFLRCRKVVPRRNQLTWQLTCHLLWPMRVTVWRLCSWFHAIYKQIKNIFYRFHAGEV